jgi:Sec-independent protein translocase protein TatA
MPFGLGVPELVVVSAIVVLLFGGRFFKDLGTGLGGFIREIRQIRKDR